MSVLSHTDVERFIAYAGEQLENKRVLYEAQIISAVEKLAEEKNINLSEMQENVFAEQWLLVNIPGLQDDRPAMRQHHEAVMKDKFEYYRRTNNFDGLCTWISSVLQNIGFTDYEANRLISTAVKIGRKLYNRNCV